MHSDGAKCEKSGLCTYIKVHVKESQVVTINVAFLATTYLEYFARIMAWESTFVDAPKLTKKLSC